MLFQPQGNRHRFGIEKSGALELAPGPDGTGHGSGKAEALGLDIPHLQAAGDPDVAAGELAIHVHAAEELDFLLRRQGGAFQGAADLRILGADLAGDVGAAGGTEILQAAEVPFALGRAGAAEAAAADAALDLCAAGNLHVVIFAAGKHPGAGNLHIHVHASLLCSMTSAVTSFCVSPRMRRMRFTSSSWNRLSP